MMRCGINGMSFEVRLYCVLFSMFLIGGYYSEKLLNRAGFRVLVLNTNLYYDQNNLTKNLDDPASQFSWADQILTNAANNKEKVKYIDFLCLAILTLHHSKYYSTNYCKLNTALYYTLPHLVSVAFAN